MNNEALSKPITGGALAAIAMLGAYLAIISALSGWDFVVLQFSEFWPYLIALSVGFGTQIGLYFYLKQLTAKRHLVHCAIATSGTTSGAVMLPVARTTSLISFQSSAQLHLWALLPNIKLVSSG